MFIALIFSILNSHAQRLGVFEIMNIGFHFPFFLLEKGIQGQLLNTEIRAWTQETKSFLLL